ncbi:MAG TPA: lysylphosphatidylglycerol synthase domain-containing protein [Cryptosporangiaceae bacterium]|nr:lysylphosphatidylglycerol synthase domain-containing protein [Cryptosporangiaceae bacterium]
MRRHALRVALSVVSLTLGALILAIGLPLVVGVSWQEIGARLGQLDAWTVAWLCVVWLAGLWAYTFVLTGSLPGLTNFQGFMLNATGSAISNVLPFGGAAGIAVTYGMARTWGHSPRAVAASVLVSGVWNTVFRFLLPAVGLVGLLASGRVPDSRIATATGVASGSLLALAAVLAVALAWKPATRWLGRTADVLARALPRRFRPALGASGASLERLRQQTVAVLRTGWLKMSLGMIGFLALQAALMAACLAATGAYPGLALTLAAFALGRVLTTVVVTPSGIGTSETGTIALLVALGSPAGPVTAGVLLFSIFTYALEIPLGVLTGAGWLLARRLRRRDAVEGRAGDDAAEPAEITPGG